MKNDIFIKNGLIIPEAELEITTSRAGGPGGQHVNKADTRVSVRWNIENTKVLTEQQKELILQRLQNRLTIEGNLIIHASASRSQNENKKKALEVLGQTIRTALYVPKKRKQSKVPQSIKEARLRAKKQRSFIKKLRTNKNYEE